MKETPIIDHSGCTGCDSCVELCPGIFERNAVTGLIEVVDLSDYPEEEIREAAKMCPAECITYAEDKA